MYSTCKAATVGEALSTLCVDGAKALRHAATGYSKCKALAHRLAPLGTADVAPRIEVVSSLKQYTRVLKLPTHRHTDTPNHGHPDAQHRSPPSLAAPGLP